MFTLQYIATRVIACSKISVEHLPKFLQDKIMFLREVMSTPSEITAEFDFYDTYHRQDLNTVHLPQYTVGSGPTLPIYQNTNKEMSASVPQSFDCLTITFIAKFHVHMSDLLQFVSDICGYEVSVADVFRVEYYTTTAVAMNDEKFIVYHKYHGHISEILSMLNDFKYNCVFHPSISVEDVHTAVGHLSFDGLEKSDGYVYDL